MKITKVCIVCGGKSPNPFGECGCSYDLEYFQNPKYYKARQLKRVLEEANVFEKLLRDNL